MVTAQELFYKMLKENDECTSTQMMIEFAKLHVQEALKQASENGEVNVLSYYEYEVDKDSILNAYNLNSIK